MSTKKVFFPSFISNSTTEINLSNCSLNLKLTNYGPEVLEDYKLYLNFENVLEVDSIDKRSSIWDLHKYNYNIKFIELLKGEFIPQSNILVQNDSITIDPICFRVKHDVSEIVIKWELFARNINSKGILNINIQPEFELEEKNKFIENADTFPVSTRIIPKIIFE